MAFFCPKCTQYALEVEMAIELPDNEWDENTFQLITCRNCGLHAAAVYQESRRGNLQGEAWQHTAAVIGSDEYHQLETLLRTCPNPGEAYCHCAAHRAVKERNFFRFGAELFQVMLPAGGEGQGGG